jgi:hypothetical protein
MDTVLPRSLLLSTLTALLLGVTPLGAQDQLAPAPGDRVRVQRLGSPAMTARLVRLAPDSLSYVADAHGGVEQTVALGELRRLEVSGGAAPAGPSALRGAGIGLLAGGALGALVAAISHDDRPCAGPLPRDPFEAIAGAVVCEHRPSARQAAVAGGFLGGLLGGAVGGVIGASNPGDRWEAVTIPARVTLSPGGAGTFTFAVVIPR